MNALKTVGFLSAITLFSSEVASAPVLAQENIAPREVKAFVYTELQNSVPFESVPWEKRNILISAQPGFISKTWLSGLGNHSTGGFYSFDSLENAQKYVTDFFPKAAETQGTAVTMRVFDADIVKDASIDMHSVHFGAHLAQKPASYVYTELQTSLDFSTFDWRTLDIELKKVQGLLTKTWLSGLGNNSVGGIYAFDTLEHAKDYAFRKFPSIAKNLNLAFYTRIFDANVTEEASENMHSPYYLQN
ncbi:MAG: YdhR family protein [Thalassolituus oleivorans]|nr:YdhR family protein [Thalassolituus oleivorans]|tara:strand:+ start:1754 stop:2491 length:738 start_codon:yes stop_codon:yes gene_type:complete